MFTGLIEAIGFVTRIEDSGEQDALREFCIDTPWRGGELPAIGASVAVDGTCLTVTHRMADSGQLRMGVATETRRRTTLGALAAGSDVHLERALRFGDRLDGHLVSGHVDGTGRVLATSTQGSALYLEVAAPASVLALSAPQGAITLSGVSLTITSMTARSLTVGLVPHTVAKTTLGRLAVGDQVNCEADLLARYVNTLLPRQPGSGAKHAQ